MSEFKYPFNSKVHILGTEYSIEVKKEEDAYCFKGHSRAFGCTSWSLRSIVLKDLISEHKNDLPEEEIAGIIVAMKKTLRHEIVHCFLVESGLKNNTKPADKWSENEEMVDWLAFQGPKIYEAWKEAGALETVEDYISKEGEKENENH